MNWPWSKSKPTPEPVPRSAVALEVMPITAIWREGVFTVFRQAGDALDIRIICSVGEHEYYVRRVQDLLKVDSHVTWIQQIERDYHEDQ